MPSNSSSNRIVQAVAQNPDFDLAPDVRALVKDHPEYVAALARNRRWNYAVNMVDSGTFAVTRAALTETTVLPFFVSQFTSNAVVIGLSPAIAWLGFSFPQVLGAYLVHNQVRHKPFIVLMAWLERLAILLMLLLALTIGFVRSEVVLSLFLLVYLAFWTTVGLLIPPYSNFYAKHIPSGRGTFLGVQALLYGLMGLVGAELVRWQLVSSTFPKNFQAILGLALLASLPAMIAFHSMREVAFPVKPARQLLRAYLAETPALMQEHPAFVQFLAIRSIIALGKMATPFLIVYVIGRFGLSNSVVATYTAIMLTAQSLSALGWGYLADRIHYRWIWLIDAAIVFAQGVLAWWAASPAWFLVIFLLIGLSLGAEAIAQPQTIYTLSPLSETVRFVGLANTVLAPVLSLGPVLGGLLINQFSYSVALGTAMAVAALAVVAVILWVFRQRQAHPASDGRETVKQHEIGTH